MTDNEGKIDDALAVRLKKARESAGYRSATEAARNLGLPESTYGAHENGSRGIPLPLIRRYATAFKVNRAWLAFGEAEDNPYFKPEPLLVLGVIQPGIWVERAEGMAGSPWAHERLGTIPVLPDQRYFKAYQYALKVQGQKIFRIAHPGEYLIAARLAELDEKIREDNYYVVRRSREEMDTWAVWRGEDILLNMKDAKRDTSSHPFAWTRSATTLKEGKFDEQILVDALIIGKYTPPDHLERPSG